MPVLAAHATCTVPVGGCGKWNVKSLGLFVITLAAGTPSISKSDAFTPVTVLLKVTLIALKLIRSDPGDGSKPATGGLVSALTVKVKMLVVKELMSVLGGAAVAADDC